MLNMSEQSENNQKIQKKKNGGARPGAGRKRGALQKLTAEAERRVQWTGQTPAEFFQEVMQDSDNPLNVRIDAARAAAVYVHRKQPEAHEISAQVTLPTPIIVLNDHK